MKTLLYFSIVLLIGCSSTTDSLTNEPNLKREKKQESLYEYQKKVLYANSEYPEILLDKARFFRDINDKKNYYRFAKGAFEQYHTLQKGIFFILDKQSKKQYLQQHKKYINELFNATYSPYYKDTFNQWLNYKRTHYDYENSLILTMQKTQNRKLKAIWNILNKRYKTLGKLNQQETNREKISILNKKIKRFEKQLSAYMIDNISNSTINYRDITNLITSNELYIDFAKVGENYYYFIIDNQANIQFNKIDKIQSEEIDNYIQRIRESFKYGNIKDISPLKVTKVRYSKLYNLIFRDINLKNKTSLIISPDGLLGLIPFEAFYDKKEQKYLIEKLKIRYIPSGKELVKLYRDKSKSQNSDIVVFADIDFNATISKTKGAEIYKGLKFGKLANSKRDVRVVKKLFPNQVKLFLEDNATERNLLKINAPKILYLSTHGFFIDDKNILNPMLKSGIALSGANRAIYNKTGDGIVTGLELAGINLHGTELVVLSACETGFGDIEEAEGVASLSKAFMLAGAKRVIMTLWSVDDNKSSILMEKFFQKVKNGFEYGEALRKAKIDMIKNNKFSHPFFWSGFVMSE
jgi:CHAT domain-containing protein